MARGPLSVTQLNGYIKGVFEDELVLHNIAVYGEIFECAVSGNTTFLTLKEGDCVLQCVRYNSTVKPEIGTKVLLNGTVTFYPKGGRVSFVYRDCSPYGESVLYAQFLKLKQKLADEGVFSGQPPLPAVIRKVAIITSITGAVIHDFVTVLADRKAFAGVTVFPVKVQGDGAAEEIAAAVAACNERAFDALVIARGGGANTDLAAFNTETVARAVGNSRIPVISAVGHETDVTLCDFAATLRVATPSVAAATVAESNAATRARVDETVARIHRSVQRAVVRATGRTSGAARRIETAADRKIVAFGGRVRLAVNRMAYGAKRLLADRARAVTAAAARADAAAAMKTVAAEQSLKLTATRLESVNPLKVLSVGYAKVCRGGTELAGVSDLRQGDAVKVIMRDGAFAADVTDVTRKRR